MKPLQFLLASINITAAATYPLLSFQHSVIARIAGISCGMLAISLSKSGIFQPIINLNNQRWTLKREVRQLESKIQHLKRQLSERSVRTQQQLQEIASQKQQELDEREQAIIEAEKELAQSIEAANSELEKDKKKFLEESEQAIAQYQSKIELLESRIDELENLIDEYEAPPLPEGSSFEILIARECMERLLRKRVICTFKGAWVDEEGYVVLRLKPKEGGQKAIEKWANYLHIEMELAEAPKFSTLRGAVQVWLKPQEMIRLPGIVPFDSPSGEGSKNLLLVKSEVPPNSAETQTPESLQKPRLEFDERLETFVEPSAKLPPYGAIRQIERDWVGYLYIYCDPPIRSQKGIIFRVYGFKSGDGVGFQSARRRLHTILKDAGIQPRTWQRRNGTNELT